MFRRLWRRPKYNYNCNLFLSLFFLLLFFHSRFSDIFLFFFSTFSSIFLFFFFFYKMLFPLVSPFSGQRGPRRGGRTQKKKKEPSLPLLPPPKKARKEKKRKKKKKKEEKKETMRPLALPPTPCRPLLGKKRKK